MPADSHRFLFALTPPPDIARRLHALAPDFPDKMLPERLHMTLAITDDFERVPEGLAPALQHAGGFVFAEAFELTLDRRRGSHRSIALRPAQAIQGLSELHRQLAAGMRRAGVPMRRGWSFGPHVTLAYRKGEPFITPTRPISWQATQFVLIESLVGRTIHRELGRWPLDAPAPLTLFDEIAA
ncbi:2'-5' RNA ligase family protein [Sphingoaurantiacus capsulatus]|uniref:2'-5' RNA ligase family protein n=1 Tax=Sphingoaurantiacus capsulatus TaxID=1771310 RepID=A0ABV7XGT5_9SPHN